MFCRLCVSWRPKSRTRSLIYPLSDLWRHFWCSHALPWSLFVWRPLTLHGVGVGVVVVVVGGAGTTTCAGPQLANLSLVCARTTTFCFFYACTACLCLHTHTHDAYNDLEGWMMRRSALSIRSISRLLLVTKTCPSRPPGVNVLESNLPQIDHELVQLISTSLSLVVLCVNSCDAKSSACAIMFALNITHNINIYLAQLKLTQSSWDQWVCLVVEKPLATNTTSASLLNVQLDSKLRFVCLLVEAEWLLLLCVRSSLLSACTLLL